MSTIVYLALYCNSSFSDIMSPAIYVSLLVMTLIDFMSRTFLRRVIINVMSQKSLHFRGLTYE